MSYGYAAFKIEAKAGEVGARLGCISFMHSRSDTS